MTNNYFPTGFGVLVVLAALAAPTNAVEHAVEVPALPTPGNAAEAQAILGAKLLVCNTCHGADGLPKSAATPVIWGQQENYLVKQLHDFHSGDRDNEVMVWMATALTPAELGPQQLISRKKTGRRAPLAPPPRRRPPSWLYARLVISRTWLVACRRRGWPARGMNIWSSRCAAMPKASGPTMPK